MPTAPVPIPGINAHSHSRRAHLLSVRFTPRTVCAASPALPSGSLLSPHQRAHRRSWADGEAQAQGQVSGTNPADVVQCSALVVSFNSSKDALPGARPALADDDADAF